MQIASGCPPVMYWLGSYIWDMTTYFFLVLITIAIFAAYKDQATVGSVGAVMGTATLFTLYGAAVIPLSYCYSFAFTSASSAQVGPSSTVHSFCSFVNMKY